MSELFRALIELAGLIIGVIEAKQSGQAIGVLQQQKADSDASARSASDRQAVDQDVNAMPDTAVSNELRDTWSSE